MEPNDHNGLLEADAAIDRVTEARERNSVPHQHRKPERPAMGSSAQVSASERSPLLGKSRSSGASGNGDNSGEPVQWFGTAELKALPWWKRPSVRLRPSLHRKYSPFWTDLVANTPVPTLHHCLWWYSCTQGEFNRKPDM